MKKIVVIGSILALLFLTGICSATDMIFPPQHDNQVTIWNERAYPNGSLAVTEDSQYYYLSWNDVYVPPEGGITCELGLFDSAGFLMPVWAGSIVVSNGTWTVLKSEVNPTNSDIYNRLKKDNMWR